ncbi:MAG: ribulose-phosphate 3-epimerase [Culicoidibacterales bacterium]
MVKILPSVLAANFSKIGAEIMAVEAGKADMHHIDIMDGHFVPNISFGPVVVKAITNIAKIPLDIHLMISNPSEYLDVFIEQKPMYISIHAEIEENVEELLLKIRENGIKPALAIKPKTKIADVEHLFPYIDMLLIMTVEPGFGGQEFIVDMVTKIKEAKALICEQEYAIEIQVDGGINQKTAELCAVAGATLLVAGSTVYNDKASYEYNIKQLRNGR